MKLSRSIHGLFSSASDLVGNRFLLSSTTFSPALFSHKSTITHQPTPSPRLDFLSRSIEKKSASLKVLVESNFERFVEQSDNRQCIHRDADQGREIESASKGLTHVMLANQRHARGASGPLILALDSTNSTSDKKKHALLKRANTACRGSKRLL